jgi:uncharacterized membrane protein YphA (DoxX/SURF4 family)/thiol-disulfide isomerase/thioredoxin
MMQVVALVLRVGLALVFLTAGAAKLADLNASRETVEAFGAPVRLARLVGTALPFAELAVALALLVEGTARWAAIAGLLLLAIFSGAVGMALSRGNTPNCNCFGQLSSEQIGPRTLARNALFVAAAVVVIVHGAGDSLGGWTKNLTAANLTAGISVLIALLSGFVALQLYRRQPAAASPVAAPDVEASEPETAQLTLSVGAEAPAFAVQDANDAQVTLETLGARGLPTLLVFATPICGPCQRLVPQLARWSVSLRDKLVIAVVESTVESADALRNYLPVREELVLMYEPRFELSSLYGVTQTPTAILIGADGRLASVPHTGPIAIERLVRSTLKQAPGQVPSAA